MPVLFRSLLVPFAPALRSQPRVPVMELRQAMKRRSRRGSELVTSSTARSPVRSVLVVPSICCLFSSIWDTVEEWSGDRETEALTLPASPMERPSSRPVRS